MQTNKELTTLEGIKAYRLAIATGSNIDVSQLGHAKFHADIELTGLSDIDEPSLQGVKSLLVEMERALDHFVVVNKVVRKGLELATISKFEHLAWKTYVQLIRKAYRKGTELRAKALKIE
jgi:lambda repressor-like predicted transcriptional regulator